MEVIDLGGGLYKVIRDGILFGDFSLDDLTSRIDFTNREIQTLLDLKQDLETIKLQITN